MSDYFHEAMLAKMVSSNAYPQGYGVGFSSDGFYNGRINNKKLIEEICQEIDNLLTNACDFVFAEDGTHDCIEREKITEIIYKYRDEKMC